MYDRRKMIRMNPEPKSTIFILDDMQSELELIADILENNGYRAITSNNTNHFYSLLEKFDADLILLDIVMPETDGFSVCEALKENPKYRSIPTIFFTSLTSNEDIKKGLELGAIDFISKPFNKEIFLLRITQALKQHKQLQKYNALFNQMSEASCLLEPIYNEKNELVDTRHLDYNRAYSNIIPFRKHDLYNKTWLELMPDTDKSWFKAIDEILKSEQKTSFIKYIDSINKWFTFKVNTISKKSFALILSDITEQKRLENSLRESEEKYREIANNISDWIWKADLNLNFTYVSPAVSKIRGLSVEQVLNHSLEEAFAPDSLQIVQTTLNKKLALIRQGDERGWEPINEELKIYNVNKGLIWIQTNARFIKGEDGQPVEIIGSARDINAQKIAEIALIESEKKYRSLFEDAKEPVALIKNNQCVECNQATLDAFGFSKKEDFLNAKPWHISPKYQPDGTLSKQKAIDIIETIREKSQHSFEWLNTHTSGSPIWFHISIAQINLAGEELFYSILRDITKRKKAELALIKSEAKYRLITDNISDLVWKTDMSLNFTYVSPSIKNLRGYTQREALGQNLHDILNPESVEEVKVHFQLKLDQIKNGNPKGWDNVVLDIMLKHKTLSYIWTQISARFIQPRSGLPIEIIGVTRDITKQKLAEIALSKSQEELIQINKDKDKFISVLSHDLIGSVGGSIQVIEMLEHKGATWDKRDAYFNYLFENTKSSFDLLSNLVAWGKASLGKNLFKPKNLTLNQIIEDVKQLNNIQLVQKKISLINHIESSKQVFADEHMLTTIYRNLLRNAIKFTNPGGCIELNLKNKGEVLVLEVKDNGVGMSDERAKNLFSINNIESEEGTQGEKGTGLGLQIAKEYVSKHEGEIWASSKIGKGTTVYFTIPKKHLT